MYMYIGVERNPIEVFPQLCLDVQYESIEATHRLTAMNI